MAGGRETEAIAELIAILDRLGIRYFAGGSVASSVHGIPRFTRDIDLVVDLREDGVETLTASLGAGFYADADQMREALRHQRPFNAIHLATGLKIDLFPLGDSPFHASELARAGLHAWAADSGNRVELRMASAEDILLQKLVWYREGGEVSDRQWSDALGIATTRPLDRSYMMRWAAELRVSDLLERVLSEAGQS